VSVPPIVAEAIRANLNLTLTEYQATDMEWYHELRAVKEAFQSGQESARAAAAAIKAEVG
jgi:hypothetical protein